MKTIELKEMQKLELDMLLVLDGVCKKHGLRYYMDGGTLLGAMCYEGFIPWDDDIDLKMPRPDYEKLLRLQHEFPPHIRLDTPRRDHCEYTMLKLIDDRTVLKEHGKTTGVYIDVFPMDGHPENTEICCRHIRQLQRLNGLFHYAVNGFSSLHGWKGVLYRFLYRPWPLYRKMTRLAKRYDYDASRCVGLLIEGDAVKERFEKDWLQPGFTLEFEGNHFPAPSGYRRHMEIFYGPHVNAPESYHNLPHWPGNHQQEVYWKE